MKSVKILILFTIFTGTLVGQESIDVRSFSDIFGRACNHLKYLESESINVENTQSAFKASIYGEYLPGGYGMSNVFYHKIPAVILNYGNRFEYAMYSQTFPTVFTNRVVEELEDLKEDFLDGYDDINAQWQVVDGQILITANYYYDGGGATESRLHFLMRHSQKLVAELIKILHEAKKDRKDELEDMNLEYLTRMDLNFLMPEEDFEEYTNDDISVKEGYYSYTLRDISVKVRNFGTHLELVYSNILPSNPGQDKLAIEKMTEIANDNIPDGNPSIKVYIPENLPDDIWIVATYEFNKSFTGDDLINYFEDFMSDFINEMDMEYEDLLEDIE